ncbi:hypothetical protein HPG69_012993 [Diceros bicornis minor]|uniref:Uncharacterized protein n=1 Tax=Diceros bicornis minor TaxID=77932 RepID=A0A7J7F194_DICBM|nr:hypothetical protein HPG69_012993 [Diceros bicornis minor]
MEGGAWNEWPSEAQSQTPTASAPVTAEPRLLAGALTGPKTRLRAPERPRPQGAGAATPPSRSFPLRRRSAPPPPPPPAGSSGWPPEQRSPGSSPPRPLPGSGLPSSPPAEMALDPAGTGAGSGGC